MLITFHSKVVAEVLMLTDHAGALLLAAGKSFKDKIRAIDEYQSAHDGSEEEDEDKAPASPMARMVGLKERAFPLLDMMRQSLAANAEVTWEVSRGW
jgi:hypothetical protein